MKTVTLSDNDVIELRLLRGELNDKLVREQATTRRTFDAGMRHARTSETERSLQHAVDLCDRMLAQLIFPAGTSSIEHASPPTVSAERARRESL